MIGPSSENPTAENDIMCLPERAHGLLPFPCLLSMTSYLRSSVFQRKLLLRCVGLITHVWETTAPDDTVVLVQPQAR